MNGLRKKRTAHAVCLLLMTSGVTHAEPETGGVWAGRYTCRQGETGMGLSIADPPARSLFWFHPLTANPDVPEGCFEMDSAHDRATGRIVLTAGRWIVRPYGYVTVDLDGAVSADGAAIAGKVLGPWCTEFQVRRVPPEQASIPGICRPKPPTVSSR